MNLKELVDGVDDRLVEEVGELLMLEDVDEVGDGEAFGVPLRDIEAVAVDVDELVGEVDKVGDDVVDDVGVAVLVEVEDGATGLDGDSDGLEIDGEIDTVVRGTPVVLV